MNIIIGIQKQTFKTVTVPFVYKQSHVTLLNNNNK